MKELFENVCEGGIGCTTQKSPTNSPNLEYSKQNDNEEEEEQENELG